LSRKGSDTREKTRAVREIALSESGGWAVGGAPAFGGDCARARALVSELALGALWAEELRVVVAVQAGAPASSLSGSHTA